MVGKSEVADTSFTLLFHQPVQNSVVQIPGLKSLHPVHVLAGVAHTVEQKVVHIVGLQLF